MRTIYFQEETLVVPDEMWRAVVHSRFWNAPEALILFTQQQHEALRRAHDPNLTE
jgi:hypothetical protein